MNALALLAALSLAASPTPTPTPTASPSTSTSTTTSTSTSARPPRSVGGFHSPRIHAPEGPLRRVVLLLDDPAARASAPPLAEALARDGALVALLDTRGWIAARAAARCAYPAGDLEVLAQQLEKERGLDSYERPAVVGLGEGALVAWAAVAQAPPGTFTGAVMVGGCPDRPLPLKLCAGSGPKPRRTAAGDRPAPRPSPAPLEALADPRGACPDGPATLARDAAARAGAVDAVPGGGPGAEAALAAAVRASLERISAAAPRPPPPAPPGVEDLPLVEVPVAGDDRRLAILLTGDGGWVGIDKALAAAFADAGVATVGLDSLKYFWKRRTPEETARAVARIMDHYAAAWRRTEVLLVGYSRGADIVPFVAARLGPAERGRLRLVAMLGPGTFAELEVHAIDLFSPVHRDAAQPTEDPVRATAGTVRMLCVHGSDEKDSLCPHLEDLPWVKEVVLPGGHHFDGGYAELARIVLDAAR